MLPLLLLSVGSSLGAIPECGKTTLTSLPEGDPQVFLSGQDNCKLSEQTTNNIKKTLTSLPEEDPQVFLSRQDNNKL